MASADSGATSKLGLIGIGNIGFAAASRLLSLGHTLAVYDTNRSAVERAIQLGATAAASPSDLARDCQIVLLSLPSPDVVAAVASEVVAHGQAGLVIVDLSTNDPQTARRIHEAARARSIAYVDAPVSGGPSRARTGELTIMAGGEEDAVDRVRPVLEALAKQVEYAGASGSGATAKLLNNFVAIWGMIGVSQAFLAASSLGVSQQRLYEIMAKSSGRSYSLDRNFPKIRDQNFAPDFSLDLAEKDMRLAVQLMNDAGFDAFAQGQIHTLFARTGEGDGGSKDIAAMYGTLASLLSRDRQ